MKEIIVIMTCGLVLTTLGVLSFTFIPNTCDKIIDEFLMLFCFKSIQNGIIVIAVIGVFSTLMGMVTVYIAKGKFNYEITDSKESIGEQT